LQIIQFIKKGGIEISNYWNLLDVKGDNKNFPYLHGIEMEYFILDKYYKPIATNQKIKDLVSLFYEYIIKKIDSNQEYRKKVKLIELCNKSKLEFRNEKDDIKKFQTVLVEYYQPEYNKRVSVDIIGKDTNIGTGGFITLELVTPPCSNVKELKWWIKSIFNTTLEACRDQNMKILPIASNPWIENNFCGEHHHIGIPNKNHRVKIYNIMRLFLPLLSIMSYSSFEVKDVISFELKNNFINTKFPNCTRSYRLSQTHQLGPIPPIINFDINEFSKNTGLSQNSCRMVDLYPYSKYETLEVRIFDTQISISRSIATAILLQAICQLSLKINEKLIQIINEIYSERIYRIIRDEYKNKGLKTRVNYTDQMFRDELRNICRLCENRYTCKDKSINSTCEFNVDIKYREYYHLIRFIINQISNKLEKRLTSKDLLRQMMKLLLPYLNKLELEQNISLKTIHKTLEVGHTPSMYFFYLFHKENKKNPINNYFYNQIEKNLEMYLDEKTIWKDYYDPFFDLAN